MGIFKTDHLFEEAGRSAESCEKLIKRLKGARVRCAITMYATGAIAMGISLWNADLKMLTAFLVVMLIVQAQWLLHYDACIKMLLLMRAQKAHSAATPSPP